MLLTTSTEDVCTYHCGPTLFLKSIEFVIFLVKDVIDVWIDCCITVVDEGSIQEIPIQIGDEEFENNVTLRVKMFNENDDFLTIEKVIQVCFLKRI